MPPTGPPSNNSSMLRPMNPRRREVVEKAFAKFDPNATGFASLRELVYVYDLSRHPRVLDGSMSPSMVLDMFLHHFQPCAEARGDGTISLDEFLTFYTKMSMEVDRGRELDHDAYFERVLIHTWRLDEDQKPKLSRTCIIPTTMDLPSGLLAVSHMDFIWCAAGETDLSAGLTGYRGVVPSNFARKDLPEELRGHFAFAEEVLRYPHEYLNPEPAVLPPMDLVWDCADGHKKGIHSLVSANVKREKVPEYLRKFLFTKAESKLLQNVEWVSTKPVVNPVYKTTSSAYGVGATQLCQVILELKKKTFDGTACGNVFAGRVGKFTRDFGGGMYANRSLNVGTVKKAWGV